MNRYNSFYPNMQAAGRSAAGCGRMSRSRDLRADTGNPCPPVCPQPPQLCCAPQSNPGCSNEPLPVAMAYVSWQNWQTPYNPESALCRGTIFPVLDLPFLAYKGVRA